MEKCQFEGCEQDATTTLSPATSKQNDQKNKVGGVQWNFEAKVSVCDNHLEQVKERYSQMSDKQVSNNS
jgi:hypothetical protein